jgi:hypothetical protein
MIGPEKELDVPEVYQFRIRTLANRRLEGHRKVQVVIEIFHGANLHRPTIAVGPPCVKGKGSIEFSRAR